MTKIKKIVATIQDAKFVRPDGGWWSWCFLMAVLTAERGTDLVFASEEREKRCVWMQKKKY